MNRVRHSATLLPPVSFRLAGASGAERPVVLSGATTDEGVSALVAMIGTDENQLVINDRHIDRQTSLHRCGLAQGSLVQVIARAELIEAAVTPPGRTSVTVSLTWVSGPDAGRTITLRAGRWIVGRSPTADIRADDPQVAAHQGILSIDYDGRVSYCDTGVGRPAAFGGLPLCGLVDVPPSRSLTVGSSSFVVHIPSLTGASIPSGEDSPEQGSSENATFRAVNPWKEALHRPPRQLAQRSLAHVVAPDLDRTDRSVASSIGMISVITTLGGGIAMAVLFHQLLLMIMVGVGALGTLVTWIVRAVKHRRGRGRSRRQTAAELRRFAESLLQHQQLAEASERSNGIDLVSAVTFARGDRRLWEVRPDDSDAFTIELGTGDRRFVPQVGDSGERLALAAVDLVTAHSLLHDVPIRTTLAQGSVIGICGDLHTGVSLIRSMVCQLAAAMGPADWMLVILSRPSRDDSRRHGEPPVNRWEWADWLPHYCREMTGEDDLGAACEAAAASNRRVVVVTDRPNDLSTRTTPLRRAMNAPTANLCVITVAEQLGSLSSLCTEIVCANLDGSATWQLVSSPNSVVQRLRLIGASVATATTLAAQLARYEDPELHQSGGTNLGDIDLIGLLGESAASAAAIARGWRDGGHDVGPTALIGQSSSGTIEINLDRDGPHGLIAGTTGAGKSELLRTIVTALAITSPPEQLSFVLIDYKGGAAFDDCAALPHVVGMVTDLDEHLAARVLRSLDAEIRRREQVLRLVGAADLGAYRLARTQLGPPPHRLKSAGIMATGPNDMGRETDGGEAAGAPEQGQPPELSRLVIVVDEFAAMASELPGFLPSLVSVAQRGRSLGMHLLLATQRPAGVVNDDIRANTNMRIALRVHDTSDSTDVIGDPRAATLPRRCPGRGIIRLGVDELETFQTARCTGPAPPRTPSGMRLTDAATGTDLGPLAGSSERAITSMSYRRSEHRPQPEHQPQPECESRSAPPIRTLDLLVERIASAALLHGGEPPHRPWLDPLPTLLPSSELVGDALGLVDLPDEQRRGELVWAPDEGHLVIAGALGSGGTTALVSIGLHSAGASAPGALHLYVLDAAGSTLLEPLAGLSHCGGVVRVTEPERRARLLDRLRRLTVERPNPVRPSGRHRTLLLIDGLGALRSQLIESSHTEELNDLERIIADGPSAGIAIAATVEQAGALSASMSSRVAARWVLRVSDTSDATSLGVPRDAWPVHMPPGRGVIAGSGLEFQLAVNTSPINDLVTTINRRYTDASEAGRDHDGGTTGAGPRAHQGPQSITALATDINLNDLPAAPTATTVGVRLAFGLRSDDLATASLRLFDGEHALVAGAARSGRSTALATLAMSWQRLHPAGWLGVVAPRSFECFTVNNASVQRRSEEIVRIATSLRTDEPGLLLVDDADLVDDTGGLLQELIATHRSAFHVIVAARVETLRGYSHWSSAIKRSRKGLLLGPLSDVDGDMLGVFLPRRHGAAPVPGRGFLVCDSEAHLVQVARIHPSTERATLAVHH